MHDDAAECRRAGGCVPELRGPLRQDPQLRHLKWLTEVTGTKIGTWPVYELPMKFSHTPAYIGGPINRGAPGYGEDNAWLLTELLGMSASDVERLAEEGVI